MDLALTEAHAATTARIHDRAQQVRRELADRPDDPDMIQELDDLQTARRVIDRLTADVTSCN